ncbi:sigma-54 interaction domain-containing protein [Brevibacillus sp. B_LB10_24]|uniref:sigma-54 interaction domain-containing protein n=1 Tax=Brevibacillus sp. B_LB10_24 TaxID=3380645 RepID=UPI0038BCE9B1
MQYDQCGFFDQSYLVMSSDTMKSVYKSIDNVAKYDSTVLILGESGVGKEVLVKRIHDSSPRAKGPLVRINCGAIPDNLMESEMFGYEKGAFTGATNQGKLGLISLANKGTLFLDEIGELSPAIQVKLLRVIQERHFYPIGGVKPVMADVRFIAATNKNLRSMVDSGKFREDLYYRLNVVPIIVPSLRDRKEDIPQLIQFFLQKFQKKYNKSMTITESACRLLCEYDWPGNIRELENMIERLIVTATSDAIVHDDIPEEILVKGEQPPRFTGGTLKELMSEYECQIIKAALQHQESLNKASRQLGIDVSTLSRKCKKYQIAIPTR